MDYADYQKLQGEKFVKWLKTPLTKWAGVVLILAILVSIYLSLMNHYFIARDVDDWQYRAQISSNVEDMKKDMELVKDGLIKWQATEGNAYLVFKRPEAEMTLVMQAIDSILNRANQLEGLEISSTEYQVGMDDLRGVIRELWIPAGIYWQRHQGLPWMIATIVLWILFGGLILGSLVAQFKREKEV